MMEAGFETTKGDASIKAIGVNRVEADLLDAVVRLVRLVDKPREQRILAPLIKREIVYRLLAGGEGARLGHLASSRGDTRRISKAIGHLREHINQPLRIEDIARELGMSPGRYVERARVEAARMLLENGRDGVDAIARRCGFGTAETMRRAFIRELNVPPSAYRDRFASSTTAL